MWVTHTLCHRWPSGWLTFSVPSLADGKQNRKYRLMYALKPIVKDGFLPTWHGSEGQVIFQTATPREVPELTTHVKHCWFTWTPLGFLSTMLCHLQKQARSPAGSDKKTIKRLESITRGTSRFGGILVWSNHVLIKRKRPSLSYDDRRAHTGWQSHPKRDGLNV